ncbi:MAG: peptidoglycan-binding protein [Planctomycetes bacterium]|nr:peptidoglycan-binding protein [Planctomycetota bacterium]
MAGEETEELTFSVTELEEGVTLETGKEYRVTEKESTGRLVFRLLDEAGIEPHKNQAFEVSGANDFSASGTTDPDGVYEHAEPVPWGDYQVVVGETQRTVHPQAEGSPPQPVAIQDDEIEGGTDPSNSPEDDEDPLEDEAPLLEIQRDNGDPAPAIFDVNLTRVLRALVTPPDLEGTYTWSAGGSQVTVTAVEGAPHSATVKGVEETDEGATVGITCSFAPSEANVGQGEAKHEVEVKKRVVEVHLQRSPGPADDRGIEGLAFRVEAEGEELQTGTTPADGKIEVQLVGDQTTLTLLFEDAPVATYRVTQRTGDAEEVTLAAGQQRRLRALGYPLGTSGAEENGVDGVVGPRTERAILEFQADSELLVDGIVGSKTQGALDEPFA